MRPLFVINKGIQKVVTAVSRKFTVGSTYIANIYNPKYPSTKIQTSGVCALVNERNQVSFTFSDESTSKLKSGYATIEIYDIDLSQMIYRDNFAVIRDNSLRAESVSPDDPSMQFCTITFVNWDGTVLLRSIIERGVMPEYTGATPTRPDDDKNVYVFDQWDKPIVAAAKDTTYKATYLEYPIVYYTIRFVNYDGSLLQKLTVLRGTTPVYSGATPERQSTQWITYEFNGWDIPIVPATEDAVYTAQFIVHEVEMRYVTFNSYEGYGIPGFSNLHLHVGEIPIPPTVEEAEQRSHPLKPADTIGGDTHYVFVRWNPLISAVENDVSYTPVYSENVYTSMQGYVYLGDGQPSQGGVIPDSEGYINLGSYHPTINTPVRFGNGPYWYGLVKNTGSGGITVKNEDGTDVSFEDIKEVCGEDELRIYSGNSTIHGTD